jgi:predicted transcriptional regulator
MSSIKQITKALDKHILGIIVRALSDDLNVPEEFEEIFNLMEEEPLINLLKKTIKYDGAGIVHKRFFGKQNNTYDLPYWKVNELNKLKTLPEILVCESDDLRRYIEKYPSIFKLEKISHAKDPNNSWISPMSNRVNTFRPSELYQIICNTMKAAEEFIPKGIAFVEQRKHESILYKGNCLGLTANEAYTQLEISEMKVMDKSNLDKVVSELENVKEKLKNFSEAVRLSNVKVYGDPPQENIEPNVKTNLSKSDEKGALDSLRTTFANYTTKKKNKTKQAPIPKKKTSRRPRKIRIADTKYKDRHYIFNQNYTSIEINDFLLRIRKSGEFTNSFKVLYDIDSGNFKYSGRYRDAIRKLKNNKLIEGNKYTQTITEMGKQLVNDLKEIFGEEFKGFSETVEHNENEVIEEKPETNNSKLYEFSPDYNIVRIDTGKSYPKQIYALRGNGLTRAMGILYELYKGKYEYTTQDYAQINNVLLRSKLVKGTRENLTMTEVGKQIIEELLGKFPDKFGNPPEIEKEKLKKIEVEIDKYEDRPYKFSWNYAVAYFYTNNAEYSLYMFKSKVLSKKLEILFDISKRNFMYEHTLKLRFEDLVRYGLIGGDKKNPHLTETGKQFLEDCMELHPDKFKNKLQEAEELSSLIVSYDLHSSKLVKLKKEPIHDFYEFYLKGRYINNEDGERILLFYNKENEITNDAEELIKFTNGGIFEIRKLKNFRDLLSKLNKKKALRNTYPLELKEEFEALIRNLPEYDKLKEIEYVHKLGF